MAQEMARSTVRTFALIYGLAFLLIGLSGFIPGITIAHDHRDVTLTTGLGLAFGLFPVNVLHNLVHLLFGLWGLMAARTADGAVNYARAVSIIYLVLAVMGMIPAMNLHTTFGLVPLYGHDVWLHLLLAAIAGYFGFVHRDAKTAGAR